jgi:hypothetical protein
MPTPKGSREATGAWQVRRFGLGLFARKTRSHRTLEDYLLLNGINHEVRLLGDETERFVVGPATRKPLRGEGNLESGFKWLLCYEGSP